MNKLKTLTFAALSIALASCACTRKEPMTGAYDKSSRLTAEEDSLFKAVVLRHSDLQLKPLKVSRQVVAGMNYRYECMDKNGKKVEVTVYQPLPYTNEETRVTSVDGKEYTE